LIALPAQFILTVAIASLSWYLMEKPFNNLKHRVTPKVRPSLAA
jgi:peptidoglycan/LPS O-acetylase OafA/YrhL